MWQSRPRSRHARNGKKEDNGAAVSVAAKLAGANAAAEPSGDQLDPEIAKKIAALRAHVRESFGKVAMAMMMLPRYRHQTLGDLQHLVLEPLIRDRIAIAQPAKDRQSARRHCRRGDLGERVGGGRRSGSGTRSRRASFPVRLKAEDWNSGSINWLLDVIAPNPRPPPR